MAQPSSRPPEDDEQQPGRWGSNRFIMVLLGIVVGIFVINVLTSKPPETPPLEVQTPSGSSRDQPADSPRP